MEHKPRRRWGLFRLTWRELQLVPESPPNELLKFRTETLTLITIKRGVVTTVQERAFRCTVVVVIVT